LGKTGGAIVEKLRTAADEEENTRAKVSKIHSVDERSRTFNDMALGAGAAVPC